MNAECSALSQTPIKRSYTPWNKIFSYDNETDITFVIEARGHGKTFGLREQFIRDFLNRKEHFCVVTRHDNQIPEIARDYFGLLYKPNADGLTSSIVVRNHNFVFKKEGYVYYIQELANDMDKPESDKWEIIGYFVSLSKAQKYKEMTFTNVRRMVFDECLIEQPNARNNYLPDEFEAFTSLVYTVFREQPNVRRKHNIYLLSNACNMVNPYFERYDINTIPDKGFTWWGNKQLLLYIGDDDIYSSQMADNTIAGRMAQRSDYGQLALSNSFVEANSTDYIAKKTSGAKLLYGLSVKGHTLYVWVDMGQGLYFVNQQKVKDNRIPVYALTFADNRINYIIAKRNEPQIMGLINMYKYNCVRFDSFETQSLCLENVFRIYDFR